MPKAAIYPPTQAKLFFALLWREDWDGFNHFLHELENQWGNIKRDYRPSFYPMVKYYEKEMGAPLSRAFLFIEGKVDRAEFAKIKKWSMDWEDKTCLQEKRVINIDPGLLCLEQVLLISTKPYAHRISIPGNLYIELTYIYDRGEFKPLPWTYPDYSHRETIEIFESER